MLRSLQLLPFILLTLVACSNEDHANKDLRYQIELKNRQKIELQKNSEEQEAIAAAKSAEVDALLLAGGPEVVKKAEASRDAAFSAKLEADTALAQKEVELATVIAQLKENEIKVAESAAASEKAKISLEETNQELLDLKTALMKLEAELAAAKADSSRQPAAE